MSDGVLLFVYGTLRPPIKESDRVLCFNHSKILPFLHSSRPARIIGAELYDMGSFPAAIPGDGILQGVLLAIDPAALEILDPLEGHPELYRRARVDVETAEGSVEAWVYWAPEDLALSGEKIENGNWLR